MDKDAREQLRKIIEFHHPGFTARRKTSFPDIEQLLTEIAVNLELFEASRPAEGKFTKTALADSRADLLFKIASWFHDIYERATDTPWLSAIVDRIRRERAAIVSFNWDLVLVTHKEAKERIEAFLHPREIKSKAGRHYTPLIVPPTYLKDFNRPVFRQLWRRCTDVLSTPKKLVFLGYSLPPADLHAQFILRCGFHNQLEGRLKKDGSRYPATGPAKVTIVNPDQEAARRIEAVAGPNIP